jgi:hypothetical protein
MKYNKLYESFIEGKDICDICGSLVDKDKLIVKYPHTLFSDNSIIFKVRKICIACERNSKISEVLGE